MNSYSSDSACKVQAEPTSAGVVMSDLHLHTRRSNFVSLDHALDTVDAEFEHLVLNGDIFDFRWNVIDDTKSAVNLAVADITNLLVKRPRLTVHYVIGNHDNHLEFVEALQNPASEFARFSSHKYYLQLGNHFFLHGDCCNTKTDHHSLQIRRKRWTCQKRRPHYQAALYSMIDQLGVPIFFSCLFLPKHRIAARTLYYLESIPGGFPNGIRDIYLGHSHLPFRNFNYRGYRFHNSGSGVSNMGFKPVRFTWKKAPGKKYEHARK